MEITKLFFKVLPFAVMLGAIALFFNASYEQKIIGGTLLILGAVFSLLVFKKTRKYGWIALGLLVLCSLIWG